MNKAPYFQTFWDAYGLKRDRHAAERAWNRLTATDKRKAIDGIPNYSSDCARSGVRRMYAQGYLNHRRWEDEPSENADTQKTSQSASRPNENAEMESW